MMTIAEIRSQLDQLYQRIRKMNNRAVDDWFFVKLQHRTETKLKMIECKHTEKFKLKKELEADIKAIEQRIVFLTLSE